jgi:uncharacterized repeat protein (TIGR01451 family)
LRRCFGVAVLACSAVIGVASLQVTAAGAGAGGRPPDPNVPTAAAAIAGNGSATVSWSAPSEVDGASAASFTVTASTGQTTTVEQPNDWAIVAGLTNGAPVSFAVTATSSAGTSAASRSSNTVTPDPVAPPRGVLLGASQSVSFDNYSLLIGGKRVFIWSGEFDPWRLPSPSLWLDRLEKMKAAGFNAVTPYFDWDYSSPEPGVYDFSGIRDMNLFLNDAQKVGLYVIARPGPYINAETDGGGFPGWLVTQSGTARTDASDYVAAAEQWLSEIDPIIAAHQITKGGDVIAYQVENELFDNSSTTDAYMEALEAKARADGIDVPLTGNSSDTFVGTPAEEQIPGYDVYPLGFDCADPTSFGNPPDLSGDKLPGIPLFSPEYQGGSYDSWGGSGYANCQALTGSSFENVFYKQNLASGVTMESNYMTVGGTNWGWLPAPFVYTSYDYGSAISEAGQLPAKYTEDKLIGEMTQTVSPLTETEATAGAAASSPAVSSTERANPTTGTRFLYLRQADASSTATVTTKATFDFAPPGQGYTYDDASSALTYVGSWSHVSDQSYTGGDYDKTESFSDTAGDSVSVSFTGTSVQWIAPYAANHGIADVYLDGKLAATVDTYSGSTEFQQVAYSATGLANTTHTLEIVVTGQHDVSSSGSFVSIDAINVPAPGDLLTVPVQGSISLQGREAKLLLAGYSFDGQDLVYSTSELATERRIGDEAVALLYGDGGTSGETVLHYASNPTVSGLSGGGLTTHWDPATGDLRLDYTHGALREVRIADGHQSLLLLIASSDVAGQFWADSTGEAAADVIVEGSTLVRTAARSGASLVLTGDTSAPGPLTVWAPAGVRQLVWNGRFIHVTTDASGALIGSLSGPPTMSLPTLANWKFAFESPERLPSFDDSSWTVADHQSTTNPTAPITLPVLYADDYGYHHGFVWYRGHFTATGAETGITLTANGGQYGAFSVWVNGALLGSNTAGGQQTETFTFPAGTIRTGADNVISVLVESMGHNEDGDYGGSPPDSQKEPRGLMGAVLGTSSGTVPVVTWKLQGDVVGADDTDPTRGPLNDAGLYGTNKGWELPGYPDRDWTSLTLPDSWAARGLPAGIGWYRTTFQLSLPPGVRTPIGLKLPLDGSQEQDFIYLNGWLVGRAIDYLGPQDTFYLPEGILRDDGENMLAVAVWGLANGSGGLPEPSLVPYDVEAGGIPVADVASPSWNPATYGPPSLPANPTLALSPSSPVVNPGQAITLTATLTNSGTSPLEDASTAVDAPAGWSITPISSTPVTVASGASTRATFTVTAPASGLSPGPIELSAQATFTGAQSASSPLLATTTLQVPYSSLAASYDDLGITSNADTNPSPGFAGFDGIGTTFSAEGLAAAGLAPGSSASAGGVSFTWPDVPTATPDNTLANGQVIDVSGSGSTLGFLADTNNAALSGTGTVYYSDGTSSTYTLSAGNFWYPAGASGNPANTQVASVNYANYPSGPTTHTIYVFEESIPIDSSKTVTAVQLPTLGASLQGSAPTLHVFAIGVG